MGAALGHRAAGAPRRVLVVDDDDDIRAFVSLALEVRGYAVEVAANGLEALDVLARRSADVILLDMMMPVMDGWRFCEEKQRRPELDKIPLAVMSAAANLRRGLGPCTPQAVLPKPFLLDDLLRSIDTALAA